MSANEPVAVEPLPIVAPARVMSRERSVLIWALIVLAALIGFLSALTTWVNRQALDTQSWTKASAQLINDPQVRSALSVYIVNQVYENVDVSGQIAKNLPTKYEALGSPIAAALRSPAEQGVDQLLGQPRVVTLWENANQVAHEQLVAILENKTRPGVSTANGTVTVDLRTVVIDLAKQFGFSGNLLSNIPADAGQITVLHSNQLSVAQDTVKAIRVLSVWLVVLVLLLWALALYLARGARQATLRDIGWSIVVVGLLLLVARRVGENYTLAALTTPQTRPVGHRVWLIATQLLGQIGWALIAYGIVTVLGAALAGPTRIATRLRAWLAPILNTRQAVAWAVAGSAYLLLVLWGPTHSLRTPLGILLFGALAALGVYTLRRQTLREFPDAVYGGGPGLTGRAEALTARAEDWWGQRPRRHHHPEPATSSGAGSGSVAGELERLHTLHLSGALTDEEFQRAKQHALGLSPR